MTDDVNAKVTVDATQAVRALASIDKNVSELRKELQSLGIDLSTVNRNLDNIESGSNKAARGVKSTASAARELGTAARDTAASSRQAASAMDSTAKSTKGLAAAQQNIVSQRYALYDVANAYKILGASLAGAGVYAAVVGAQFQTAFSNVERTISVSGSNAEGQIEGIRRALINLSSQIPVSFQDLSKVATIGNEMGITSDRLVSFTQTVTRFASVAGISVDEVAKAFGAVQAQTGLSSQYFENFASAIAKVGIDSNASIPEILSLTREISRSATAAGFTADQIVGLSGTLAGLRIPPERSRGALTTYFETLNKAVVEGGDSLAAFSAITNTTAEDLTRMVNAGQGAEVFQRFLQGLNSAGGQTTAVTQALDALGLAQLRVTDTFRGLSSRIDLFTRDQRNAHEAFMAGAELNRQYAITMENLSSQWQIFINGINELISAVSGGAIPSLVGLFQVVNQVIFAVSNWLEDNQWVASLIAFGFAAATVTGVLALLRGGLFAARGAALAFSLMEYQAGVAGIAGANGARVFAGGAITAGNAAAASTGRVLTFGRALAAVGKMSLFGLAITAGGALLGGLASDFVKTDSSAKNATLSMAQYNKAMSDANSLTKAAGGSAGDLADALNGGGGGGGGGGVAGAADDAAKKVRTLVDYVGELTGVFKRSSDIRFGPQAAMDDITLKWINLNEKIAEYQQKVRTLTADKSLRQYWLQNAIAYDDQIRAGQLREEIAKIDDDLADANKGASTELKGNSKAAIENRKTMRDLAGSYDEYIAALAAAGASQSEIQAIIQSLNGDFIAQGTQLGYSASSVQDYAARFGDLSKIISQIPRDITIGFNPDPAQAALDEFFAKAQEQARQAGSGAGGAAGDGFGGGLGDSLDGIGAGGGGADPFGEFWNGEQDRQSSIADLLGQGAGTQWIESLIAKVQAGDWGGVWDDILKGWNDSWGLYWDSLDVAWNVVLDNWNKTIENADWFKNIKSVFDAGNVFFGDLGKNFADAFGGSAKDKLDENDPIGSYANEQEGYAPGLGITLGQSYGDSVSKKVSEVLGSTNSIGTWAADQALKGTGYGSNIGNTVGSGTASGISGKLSASSPIWAWVNSTNDSAWGAGASAGSSVGRGLVYSIGLSLDSIWNSVSSVTRTLTSTFPSKGHAMGGYVGGFSAGGYTGPGHWLKPAGFVHAGEYVVPKKHVDQRTGLPDVNYVASLQRSRSAPKMGYAGGGHVGAFPSSFELGPHSLQWIANSLSVSIGIGQKELAKASSRGDRENAWAGSN